MSSQNALNAEERLSLAETRSQNLRQLLLRAHRKMNAVVAEGLALRGHTDIRLIHSRLLENLDREGNTISVVAKRAEMTKQAMGALAKELEAKGYLRRLVDEGDGRAWRLRFTARGWRLMLDSFEIVANAERQAAAELGASEFQALRTGLTALANEGTAVTASRRRAHGRRQVASVIHCRPRRNGGST